MRINKNFSYVSDLLIGYGELLEKIGFKNEELDKVYSGEIFEDISDDFFKDDPKKRIKILVEKLDKRRVDSAMKEYDKLNDEEIKTHINFSLNHKLNCIVPIRTILQSIMEDTKTEIKSEDLDTLANFIGEVYNGNKKIDDYDQKFLEKIEVTEDVLKDLYTEISDEVKDYENEMQNNFSKREKIRIRDLTGGQIYEITDDGNGNYTVTKAIKKNNDETDLSVGTELSEEELEDFEIYEDFNGHRNFSENKNEGNSKVYCIQKKMSNGKFEILEMTKSESIEACEELAKSMMLVDGEYIIASYDSEDKDGSTFREEKKINFSRKLRAPCRFHKNFSNFSYPEDKSNPDLPARLKYTIENPRY